MTYLTDSQKLADRRLYSDLIEALSGANPWLFMEPDTLRVAREASSGDMLKAYKLVYQTPGLNTLIFSPAPGMEADAALQSLIDRDTKLLSVRSAPVLTSGYSASSSPESAPLPADSCFHRACETAARNRFLQACKVTEPAPNSTMLYPDIWRSRLDCKKSPKAKTQYRYWKRADIHHP